MSDDSSLNDLRPNTTRRLKVLRVDSVWVGLPEDEITTIAKWIDPAPLPFAPESVLGVVCIQGRMFTVLELAGRLRPNEANISARHSLRSYIVALRGEEQLALAVDAAEETIEVSAEDIKTSGESSPRFFLGTVGHAGHDMRVLAVRELFSATDGSERRRRRF